MGANLLLSELFRSFCDQTSNFFPCHGQLLSKTLRQVDPSVQIINHSHQGHHILVPVAQRKHWVTSNSNNSTTTMTITPTDSSSQNHYLHLHRVLAFHPVDCGVGGMIIIYQENPFHPLQPSANIYHWYSASLPPSFYSL